MKVLKYGFGMKPKKHYITKCHDCNSTFSASSVDVEFLDDKNNVVDHPTPKYRTYCPVCGHTQIFDIRKRRLFKPIHDYNTLYMLAVIALTMIIVSMITECVPHGACIGIRLGINGVLFFIILAISEEREI